MDLKTAVVRLNFQNYDLWKERTKQVLIREGLWRVIVEELPRPECRTEVWIDKDDRAAATIGYLVEDSQLQLIKNAGSAQETWNIIRDYHVKHSSAGQVGLVKRLCRMELEQDGDVEKHLMDMDSLFDKLLEVGCEIPDSMKASFILASLPEGYDSFVTMMEGNDTKLTVKVVKAKLLNEFYKRREKVKAKEETAMKVSASKGRKFSGKAEQSDRVCYECGKMGHIRKNCYKYLARLAEEQGIGHSDEEEPIKSKAKCAARSAVQEEKNRAVCFSAISAGSGHGWIVDSGASKHMTSDRKFFESFRQEEEAVHLADGRVLNVNGSGNGSIKGVDIQGRPVVVRLKNVLYVPDLQRNIISVGVMAKSGAQVEFGECDCRIKKHGSVVLVGVASNGVYKLK